MVRNILNELTARGVRHLIISALFFVVYALCGTAIMLTVLFLIDRHIPVSYTHLTLPTNREM